VKYDVILLIIGISLLCRLMRLISLQDSTSIVNQSVNNYWIFHHVFPGVLQNPYHLLFADQVFRCLLEVFYDPIIKKYMMIVYILDHIYLFRLLNLKVPTCTSINVRVLGNLPEKLEVSKSLKMNSCRICLQEKNCHQRVLKSVKGGVCFTT
jgi:hypothetical protein